MTTHSHTHKKKKRGILEIKIVINEIKNLTDDLNTEWIQLKSNF